MKKLVTFLLSAIFILTLTFNLTACNKEKTIVVGASPTPHAKILEVIKEDLKAEGWTLQIKEYSDYVLPNQSLWDGSLDANFFQHLPYLNNYNSENNTDLVSVASIHYEPLAVFGNGVSKLDNLANGAVIFIPNDNSNGTRALFLLAQEGLITLPEGASAEEGVKPNEVINPNNYEITSVKAELLVANLNNTDNCLAVINGNYALSGKLNFDSALAYENAGEAALLYSNIIAVKKGNETSEKTLALIKALKSEKVSKYISETFGKTVVSVI